MCLLHIHTNLFHVNSELKNELKNEIEAQLYVFFVLLSLSGPILPANLINSTAADSRAICVARSLAAVILTV